MALDLTGINNENEFYTHHYLSAILENDLKDLFASWRKREEDENIRSPHVELRGQGRDYFIFLNNCIASCFHFRMFKNLIDFEFSEQMNKPVPVEFVIFITPQNRHGEQYNTVLFRIEDFI